MLFILEAASTFPLLLLLWLQEFIYITSIIIVYAMYYTHIATATDTVTTTTGPLAPAAAAPPSPLATTAFALVLLM